MMDQRTPMLADLVTHASDPAFAINADMKVSGWNRAATKLLGYTETDTVGLHCGSVLQAVCPSGEPLCSGACAGSECFTLGDKWSIGTCHIRHKDGRMIPASLSTMVIPVAARSAVDGAIALIFIHGSVENESTTISELPLRLFTLGHFAVTYDSKGLSVETWKRRQAVVLLKCLLSHRGRPLHRERIIEWIWPESEPDKAWRRLKVVISFLRNKFREAGATREIIETHGKSYLLRRQIVWIDAEVFDVLAVAGRERLAKGDLAAAQKIFEDAVVLYKGDYFEDDSFAEWCAVERERLREVYLELLGGLARCYKETGAYAAAERVCRKAISVDPSRENFVRSAMEIMVIRGQIDQARSFFLSWRRSLDHNFGLHPMPETLQTYNSLIDETRTI